MKSNPQQIKYRMIKSKKKINCTKAYKIKKIEIKRIRVNQNKK
jgi:hypothetical protein